MRDRPRVASCCGSGMIHMMWLIHSYLNVFPIPGHIAVEINKRLCDHYDKYNVIE